MIRSIVISFAVLTSLPCFAQQVSMWGTGMYGGTQGCSYQRTAGAGAQSENDEIKEIQQSIQEMQKQKKQKQTEMSRLEKREMRDSLATINDVISADYAEFVVNHINVGRSCMEYKGLGDANSTIAAGDEGGTAVQAPDTESSEPFTIEEWGQICDRSKSGSVSGSVCTIRKFRAEDKGTHTVEDCKNALSGYRKQKIQKDKLNREIAALDRSIKNEKDRLKDAKADALQAQRDGMNSPNSDTEGGVCVNCISSGNGYTYQKPQTDWTNVVANVGTGVLATFLGYKSQQMVTEANSNLGWPTQSYPSWSYGLPYFAQGIYGAIGGGTGQGAFGCGGSGGLNGSLGGGAGGAFGYPQGVMGMNTLGGGLFNGGMGPWGMNGMNSLSGMGGYGMGGMMGGYGNMMGGYGNMMGLGGVLSGGMMMSGYPMGSMMGSMTGYGNMMSGYGNMMNGYGSMSSDPLMMQYQQQAMQMQMQYYQQYQQQQMQRYQTMSSLQQEMYSLMYKMQSLQYGYSSGTGYIGSTTGTGLSSGYTTVPMGGLITGGYSTYNSYAPSAIPTTSTTTTINGTGR